MSHSPMRVIVPCDVFLRVVLGLKEMSRHLNSATRPLPPIAEGLPDETLHHLECLAGHMGDVQQILQTCWEESK